MHEPVESATDIIVGVAGDEGGRRATDKDLSLRMRMQLAQHPQKSGPG